MNLQIPHWEEYVVYPLFCTIILPQYTSVCLTGDSNFGYNACKRAVNNVLHKINLVEHRNTKIHGNFC